MEAPEITASLPEILFWGILTFSLIVVIHEIGHFAAAKMFHVKVHEFMIGLPGPAIRLHTRWTTFGVSIVPLGGYIRIAGMDPGPEDDRLDDALWEIVRQGRGDAGSLASVLDVSYERAASLLVTLTDWGAVSVVEDDPGRYDSLIEAREGEDREALLARARSVTFRGRKTWQRIVILGSGVFVNILAAILAFSVVFSLFGYISLTNRVNAVLPDTAAAETDLAEGDVVLAIDGRETEDGLAILEAIGGAETGDEITVTVRRSGATRHIVATLGESEGHPFLGIEMVYEQVRLPFHESMWESVKLTGLVFVALGNLFRPDRFQEAISDARGVVGVSVEAAQAVERGPIDYAWILALLSLSLGVLNIFPIPPLDGGKITLEIVEKIKGSPLRREWTLGMSALGAALIFSLIGYLVYADLVRYVFNG